METCDDRRLIDDYLIGSEAAVRTVARWIEVALRTGHRSSGADHEDLIQEVQARVLGNLRSGRFDGRSSLRTYVHRIAMNTRIDADRRGRRRQAREAPLEGLEETLPAQDTTAGSAENNDLARRIMKALPETDRLILDLIFAQQLSYAEIARRLGISESAVKTRVMRCKNRLVRRFGRLFRRGGG